MKIFKKFKIGSTVKINKKSVYYNTSENPTCNGEIIEINKNCNYIYRVEFLNGDINAYRKEDLIIIKK